MNRTPFFKASRLAFVVMALAGGQAAAAQTQTLSIESLMNAQARPSRRAA